VVWWLLTGIKFIGFHSEWIVSRTIWYLLNTTFSSPATFLRLKIELNSASCVWHVTKQHSFSTCMILKRRKILEKIGENKKFWEFFSLREGGSPIPKSKCQNSDQKMNIFVKTKNYPKGLKCKINHIQGCQRGLKNITSQNFPWNTDKMPTKNTEFLAKYR